RRDRRASDAEERRAGGRIFTGDQARVSHARSIAARAGIEREPRARRLGSYAGVLRRPARLQRRTARAEAAADANAPCAAREAHLPLGALHSRLEKALRGIQECAGRGGDVERRRLLAMVVRDASRALRNLSPVAVAVLRAR